MRYNAAKKSLSGAKGRDRQMRKIFVIGFNRCGLTSMASMFRAAGIRTLHYRADDDDMILGSQISANLSTGRQILAGLNRFTAFLDFSFVCDWITFEGNRFFWQLHAEHPDAYFILNTRPLENWVTSRAEYLDGRYVEAYALALGFSPIKTQQTWRKQYLAHLQDVDEHFKDIEGSLLVFDIESDDPQVLCDFLAEDYELEASDWMPLNTSRDEQPPDIGHGDAV